MLSPLRHPCIPAPLSELFLLSGLIKLLVLFQIAVKKECVGLEWNVLDSNKVAIDFYDNLGAERLDEWRKYHLSEEQLIEFAGN